MLRTSNDVNSYLLGSWVITIQFASDIIEFWVALMRIVFKMSPCLPDLKENWGKSRKALKLSLSTWSRLKSSCFIVRAWSKSKIRSFIIDYSRHIAVQGIRASELQSAHFRDLTGRTVTISVAWNLPVSMTCRQSSGRTELCFVCGVCQNLLHSALLRHERERELLHPALLRQRKESLFSFSSSPRDLPNWSSSQVKGKLKFLFRESRLSWELVRVF